MAPATPPGLHRKTVTLSGNPTFYHTSRRSRSGVLVFAIQDDFADRAEAPPFSGNLTFYRTCPAESARSLTKRVIFGTAQNRWLLVSHMETQCFRLVKRDPWTGTRFEAGHFRDGLEQVFTRFMNENTMLSDS